MIIINYALQVCDIASNQSQLRYCSDSKTEVSIKCVTSFLRSVEYCAKQNSDAKHRIMIFDDKSSDVIVSFLKKAQLIYSKNNVEITIQRINSTGIMDSIRTCWEWLKDQDGDIVYQVQDDYLYTEDAIYQMICMFMQVYNDTRVEIIVNPYNDPYWYRHPNCYQSRPLTITPSIKQYWIRCYDIPCTFMTSKNEFNKHWDLYEKFLNHTMSSGLESNTINKILSQNRTIGYTPSTSIALHMQSEFEKDPYIDWKERWDSVPTI